MSRAKTVLIVDDDVPFADFVRAAVESLGHRAVIVTNGVDALPTFEQSAPDMVFLDLLLPKRDGFKVCEDIRTHARGATVPVAMMTGIYKKALYEREGLEKHGATAYVYKPFGVREVWRLVEKHLGAGPMREPAADPTSGSGHSLVETPLALILGEHLRRQSNGVLFVRGRDATYVVYLRWGEPVFVRSNDPDDRLDKVLLRTGQVSQDQVAAALRVATESRGRTRLGQALIAAGALQQQQFEVALQLQLQLIFKKAFALEEGQVLFVEGEHPTEEEHTLKTAPRAVVYRGALATGSRSAVMRHLPPPHALIGRRSGWESVLPDLPIGEPEAHLLRLADGSVTVERFLAVAAVAGLDGPRILFGFLAVDALTQEAEPAPALHARRGRPEHVPRGAVDPGRWEGAPFGAAFVDLIASGASGALTVRAADAGPGKVIVLRDGEVVAVRSDLTEDRLADMVLRLATVEEPKLLEAMDTLGPEPDDAALARTLLGRGLLSPLELYWAAVYQAHQAVAGLMAVSSPRLEWSPGPVDDAFTVLPDVPTAELVLEAARNLPRDVATAHLPRADAWVQATSEALDRSTSLPLGPGEAELLKELHAPSTVEQVMGRAGSDPGLAISLLALVVTRLVVPVEAPAPAGVVATGDGGATLPPVAPAETAAEAFAPAVAAGDRVDFAASFMDATQDEGAALDVCIQLDDEPATPACAEADDTLPGGIAPVSGPLDVPFSVASTIAPPAAVEPAAFAPPPVPAAPPEEDLGARDRERWLEVSRGLRATAPLLRTLRTAFDGERRKVEVDSERMAELIDRLLALAEVAGAPARRPRTAPPAAPSDEPALESGSSEDSTAEDREPVGSPA